MMRAGVGLFFALALLGCISAKTNMRLLESVQNHDASGYPRWQRTTPPALAGTTSVGARDVILLFPAIDNKQVLHWNAAESVRLVLPRSPAMLVDRIPRGRILGDIRTKDRLLSKDEYARIRCGFGRSWDGAKYEPKTFMVTPFCENRDVEKEHDASVPIVDDVLDDLRARAVEAGGVVASDIRCYIASDPQRLWCEASVETPPSTVTRGQ